MIAAAYSPETLRAVFNAFCNPTDWRAPLAVKSHGSAVPVVCEAIEFFTGTVPKVTRTGPEDFLVTSVGYRLGPCGDH